MQAHEDKKRESRNQVRLLDFFEHKTAEKYTEQKGHSAP